MNVEARADRKPFTISRGIINKTLLFAPFAPGLLLTACQLVAQQEESEKNVAETVIALEEQLGGADAPPAETPKPFQAPEKIVATLAPPAQIPPAAEAQKPISPNQAPTQVPTGTRVAERQIPSPIPPKPVQVMVEKTKTAEQPVDKDWIRIRSEHLGILYQIDLPYGWTYRPIILKGDEKEEDEKIDDFTGKTVEKYPTHVDISIETEDTSKNAQSYTQYQFELQKGGIQRTIPGIDPVKEGLIFVSKFNRLVDGEEAWTLTKQLPKAGKNAVPFKYMMVIFSKKGRVWSISYGAHDSIFDQTLPVFHKILDSFKVL